MALDAHNFFQLPLTELEMLEEGLSSEVYSEPEDKKMTWSPSLLKLNDSGNLWNKLEYAERIDRQVLSVPRKSPHCPLAMISVVRRY